MRTVATVFRDFPRRYGRITQSKTYVPQIDGLRFIAIVQVVLFHACFRAVRAVLPLKTIHNGWAAYLPNGAAGVELFFFISGYIIAFPFLAGHKPSLASFYGRRIYRLEPPYLLVLFGCFLLLTVAGNHVGYAPQMEKSDVPIPLSFLASCFYLHQLIFQAPPRLDPPLWSLELEIQFYLLAPFIIAGYRALGGRTIRMTLGIVAAAAFLVAQVVVTRMVPYLHFTIFGNLYPFLIGIVLCDAAVERSPFHAAASLAYDLLFVLGFALFLLSAILWYPWVQRVPTGLADLAMRAVSIPLLFYGAARGRVARKVIGAPWIALIGGACYSIYLVHVPVMQALGNIVLKHAHAGSAGMAILLAVVTLVPAGIFSGMIYYLLIERPCMRKDWPTDLWAFLTRKPRPDDHGMAARPTSDLAAAPVAVKPVDAPAG
jgi:peptidoglycan/LPS O-acetylase OafA/YrhL